ncbi:MAG: glucose-6-phosphate dehydrogenase [Dehalococcoidia bacterium]
MREPAADELLRDDRYDDEEGVDYDVVPERPSGPEGAGTLAGYTLKPPPDQDIILVGATGDLARRKLIPAIYDLFIDGLLPNEGAIIGYAREETDDETFKLRAANAIKAHARRPLYDEAWIELRDRLVYVPRSAGGLGFAGKRTTKDRRLIYLSTPPTAVPGLVDEIAEANLVEGTRLVIEKPFGFDLGSSQDLDRRLRGHFDESQIFRIDHYLGKETVQNIMVLRFGNHIWERVWNRDAIDHVQITVAESIGTGGRAAFYDGVGAMRDIIQNHALQVLSMVAMEPPINFTANAIRDETAKALQAMKLVQPKDVVRGQYTSGTVEGRPALGYREETGVPPDSETETYVALRAEIDNWRWAGVPFYLRTGKRLPRRDTEVLISFKEAPVHLWESVGLDMDEHRPNHLAIRIQPDEGITFTFMAKVPGPEIGLRAVNMHFSYEDSFMTEPAEAYERLLFDAMDGDAMLFLRDDAVRRSWEVLQPVLDDMPPLQFYPAGSWGPRGADALIGERRWHMHEKHIPH